jgi:DNA mismatch repair protein MutS
MSGSDGQVLDEIARLRPAEVLIPELPSGQPHDIARPIQALGFCALTARPGWQFTLHHAKEELKRQWHFSATGGIGFEEDDPAIFATAAILSYLRETQKTSLTHLRPPRRHVIEDHLAIDPSSWRSLEIDRTVRGGTTEGSLLSAIDRTRTTMGARLLRQWLRHPLNDIEHIEARQNAIAALLATPASLKGIIAALEDVCDIERIIGRITVGRAQPRDLAALGRCLKSIPTLLDRLEQLSGANDVAPELINSSRNARSARSERGILWKRFCPTPRPIFARAA